MNKDDEVQWRGSMLPPPPMLSELLGPREHIKFLLALNSRPVTAEEGPQHRQKGKLLEAASASSDYSDESTTRKFDASRFAVLVSNLSNADDVELSALLLIDTGRWNVLTVLPVIPDWLHIESRTPTHISVRIEKKYWTDSYQRTDEEVIPSSGEMHIEGWSADILLLQDLHLLLNLSSTSVRDYRLQTHMLSRWMWLKRYCSSDQFTVIKKMLHYRQEKEQAPISSGWGASTGPPDLAANVPQAHELRSGFKVATVTYNVGGADPPSSAASIEFLSDPILQRADIVAVGLQEVDQSSSAYLWFDPSRQEAWIKVIGLALQHGTKEFTKRLGWNLVAVKQHVTILLLVYRQRDPQTFTEEPLLSALSGNEETRGSLQIDQVSLTSVGVGLGGFLANKGAVGVRFRVRKQQGENHNEVTTICFVTAHLSAGTGRMAMERRIWDWEEIQRRMRFAVPLASANQTETVIETETANDQDGETFRRIGILKHDHTILFGDLNSRLPLSLSSSHVQRLLRRGQVGAKMLQGYDELKVALMMANDSSLGIVGVDDTSLMLIQSWRGWRESDLTFPPTYKFDTRTSTYDTSEKQRVPSWTDRVLAHTNTSPLDVLSENTRCRTPVTFEVYQAHPQTFLSDHKPVSALIHVPWS